MDSTEETLQGARDADIVQLLMTVADLDRRLTLNLAELAIARREAVQALARRGMSVRDIAALQIGMSKSAVGRHLAALSGGHLTGASPERPIHSV